MPGELLYLAKQASTPFHVHGKPLIHQGRIISEEETDHGRGRLETRGDVITQWLWEIQTDAIINIIFEDADADTYKYYTMYKLLAHWDKEIKNNQSKHCQ